MRIEEPSPERIDEKRAWDRFLLGYEGVGGDYSPFRPDNKPGCRLEFKERWVLIDNATGRHWNIYSAMMEKYNLTYPEALLQLYVESPLVGKHTPQPKKIDTSISFSILHQWTQRGISYWAKRFVNHLDFEWLQQVRAYGWSNSMKHPLLMFSYRCNDKYKLYAPGSKKFISYLGKVEEPRVMPLFPEV